MISGSVADGDNSIKENEKEEKKHRKGNRAMQYHSRLVYRVAHKMFHDFPLNSHLIP